MHSEAIGVGMSPSVAVSYLLVGATLYAMALKVKVESVPPSEHTSHVLVVDDVLTPKPSGVAP